MKYANNIFVQISLKTLIFAFSNDIIIYAHLMLYYDIYLKKIIISQKKLSIHIITIQQNKIIKSHVTT